MRRYLLEETHELIHAINQGDFENLVEELGDLLFHVFFFARMGEEQRRFDLEDIARGISDKLIRRHPHVFGDVAVNGIDVILKNWETIKANEKAAQATDPESDAPETPAAKSAIPAKTGRELPALMRAEKIQAKAAKVGFDWTDADAGLRKIEEEIAELRVEMQWDRRREAERNNQGDAEHQQDRLEDELGDVLFSVVNLARHLRLDPEVSLDRANTKFLQRFHVMEDLARRQGLEFATLDEAGLDALWNQAKLQAVPARGEKF